VETQGICMPLGPCMPPVFEKKMFWKIRSKTDSTGTGGGGKDFLIHILIPGFPLKNEDSIL